MKLLYLTTWDFSNEESDGVCKKIYSHLSVFEKAGCQVDFIYIKDDEILYRESGRCRSIGRVGAIKKTWAYMMMYKHLKDAKYDCVYNRYGMMDTFYYRVLKVLKKNGAKILAEIPTYPYVNERVQGLLPWFMFKWDEIYLRKLEKVIFRVATYSQDQAIWDIPTIRIMNGIDIEKVKCIRASEKDDTIDLLAIALMQPYHGYERLIYGLRDYYKNGGQRKILIHVVGEGPEKVVYEKIVREEKLEDKVLFHGRKSGNELEEIYQRMDIGVCSLGSYKKNIFLSSELKTREFLAKGLPFIAGIKVDIFDVMDSKYYLEFTNDPTIIDMEQVIEFYDSLYSEPNVHEKIRKSAEKYISMEATMKPVCDVIDTI